MYIPLVSHTLLVYTLCKAPFFFAKNNSPVGEGSTDGDGSRATRILNLSSWTTRRLPLEQWLVEEQQRRYLIPRQQSQRWVQQTKLLPLLDGLNEEATFAREACIEAINTYQSEHLVPLVICSRREEYQALSERLTLQSAVIIQPLSSEQVKDYLVKAGEALAAVQTAMNTNPVLQELLTTPLMLSVVTLTYQDKAVKDLSYGSPEEQQHQVFERYVTQTLEKKRERSWHYASQPTRKWLSWLAALWPDCSPGSRYRRA